MVNSPRDGSSSMGDKEMMKWPHITLRLLSGSALVTLSLLPESTLLHCELLGHFQAGRTLRALLQPALL